MPYFDKEPGPQPNPYASMFSQLTASYSTLQSMALKQLLDKEYFKSGSVMSAQDKNSFFSAAAAMAAAASLSDQLKIDIPNSDQLFKYPFKTKSFVKKSSPAAAIPSLPTTATAASFIDTNNNIPNRMETNITLWQFLLELLLNNQYKSIITWTNNEGEFKLVNAEEVARLWGLRKNKHNMNYDKLSRALRYYYDKNIIKKVLGQKFVYKFVSCPDMKLDSKLPFNMKINTYNNYVNSNISQSPHYSAEMKDSILNNFSRHQLPNNFVEPNNNNIYFTSMEPTDLSFKTGKNLSKKRNNETDCESVSSEGAWTENSDNCSTSLSINSHNNGNKRAKMARSVLSSPISNRSSSPSNRSVTSSPVTAESYSNLSNDCSPVNLSQSASNSEKDSEKSTSTKSKDSNGNGSSSSTSGSTKSKPKPPPISAIPIPSFPQSLQTPIVTYASPFLAKHSHTPANMLNSFAFFNSLSPLLLQSPRYGNGTHFQFPIGATPPTPTSMMSMPPLSPFSTTPFSPSLFDPQLILPSPSKSIPVLQ